MFYSKLAWQNIQKNRQFYLPYIFANIFTVMIFFTMVNFISNDSLKASGGGEDAITVINLGSIIIGLFATVFLFYSNSFLIKRRKKEFGLYNILGMEKRHISKILLFENLYIYIITLLSGVAVGTLFFKLMHLVLMKLMTCEIPLGFEFHTLPVLKTAILFGVISILILINCIRQVYVSNPIELLRSSQLGEKEPKSKLLLAILGTVFLGIGYYLAITSTNAIKALEMFFIAVICVIIGTYLIFTTGSIVILKILRKNKNFYYNINHFTAISGMIYRMKQNAMGLGNIAILSTMTIIALSGSISLYVGVNDILEHRYPKDVQIQYTNKDNTDTTLPNRDTIYSILEDDLSKSTLSMSNFQQYDTFNITVIRNDTGVEIKNPDTEDVDIGEYLPDNVSIITFMNLDDYNTITNCNQTLNDDEILMYSIGYDIPDTFTIDDSSYSVKRIDSFPIESGYFNITGVSEIYVVFKNKLQMDSIYLKQLEILNYPSNWNYYAMFNLSGTDEEKITFSDSFYNDLYIDEFENFSKSVVTRQERKEDFYSLYGSLLFLGIFLGITFLMATGLIIYYKQLSEGYEDKQRFNIMQKVGLSKSEVKKTIHTQILMVFFLPLITAIVHTAFAFPMLRQILQSFGLNNIKLFLMCTSVCIVIFGAIYGLIYSFTAKIYYDIVE